ncbi:LuxR C-terminal-related transcriptional regulator [Streptomyces sp. WI04-05B]|uniref:LuxR C-terminal-related transcriptional regulator n=1 Tax=Streptomyces TaxID=1883 RepID=UPI0029A29433|nr:MULTISPECIES: LuxR C-terminal-related transcriptional regulator [unclassified Streptomyces]MDX2546053.1 LuxR C-terminal-related transcriptional regulator [Streptomyces sp. WI04-05B]MDX2582646.1 LuxR C-terminal-related transcriptional regulator [Streptomyces sp. WI04-05A]MDX3747039.1 LuxR C-terminal-related transcriptional regulator [Streptomyces sp. AK08-02]
MLSHHQIAAATRIGMLTRERDTVAACDQALDELRRALPLDMATLLTIDPLTGEHIQLAGIGYTAETSQALAAEFVDTPWYRNVVRQDVPPSISEDADDPGQRFRHGWFYADRVRPAGVRDAMTGALRHDGRLVGLITLSTRDADAYDTEARHLLASVIPALGALADPTAHTGDLHGLPAEGAATLVAEGGSVGLPGRERARVAADEEFRPLLRAFARTRGRRLRLLWPLDGTWYRVSLYRHTTHRHTSATGPTGSADAVLVHETPTELPYGLSPRELEVLTRAAIGQTNQAIAQALFLSPRTVHSHIEHLLRKTGAASRAEATALAVRDGLLRPAPDHLDHFVERGA